MKQKKSEKKLNLNKKTVTILDSRQIGAVYGGDDHTDLSFCFCCTGGNIYSCPPPVPQDPTFHIVCCY